MIDNKKNTILIVDDQPNNLKLIASILSNDFDLLIANSGNRALNILDKKLPDLILMDVMMPEMSGYEACEIIKSKNEWKDIPLIFLTAKVDTEDIIKGFELGAVDYISKPFNKSEMMTRVNTHMNLYISKIKIQEMYETIRLNECKLLEKNELLEKQAIELKLSNDTKDKFFSIIAHDLRNPFAALLNYYELLENYYDKMDDKQVFDVIKQIGFTSKNTYTLLDNLLKWSRSQQGSLTFNPEKLQLNTVFDKLTHCMMPYANQKNIRVINNIYQPLEIDGDIEMLTTVFRNLLSNSIKFTNSDGFIEIGIYKIDTELNQFTVFIKDNGIGMSEKQIQELLSSKLIHSRKGTNNESGSGLGIQLCREFIGKHNGKLTISSKENEGTTFYITFNK